MFKTHLIATTLVLLVTTQAMAQTTGDTPKVNDPTITTPTQPTAVKQKTKDKVIHLLSGYEYFPKRAELAKLGNDVTISTILLSIATDSKVSTVRRIRAIDAMGYYNNTPIVSFLTKTLNQSTKNIKNKGQLRFTMSQRHHALSSLARAQKKAALPVLKKVLTHQNYQLKLSAISAIGKHCGKDGKVVLAAINSKDPIVQREVRKHLGR